jgi:hypothetical protein
VALLVQNPSKEFINSTVSLNTFKKIFVIGSSKIVTIIHCLSSTLLAIRKIHLKIAQLELLECLYKIQS